MNNETKTFLRRYGICVGLLAVSCVVLPLLVLGAHSVGGALPRWLSNALFFWPQYVLWPNGLAERDTEAVHFAAALPWATIIFWLVTSAAYVALLMRVRLLWVVAAFIPAVAVVAQLGLWTVSALGLRLVLDSL
ncbi:MAG TPA: hypothetical protein VFO94_10075 [Gammaproteobacteria bacterium]|nr:hypothetical protein [Gammaproteobacteria bacterium]